MPISTGSFGLGRSPESYRFLVLQNRLEYILETISMEIFKKCMHHYKKHGSFKKQIVWGEAPSAPLDPPMIIVIP